MAPDRRFPSWAEDEESQALYKKRQRVVLLDRIWRGFWVVAMSVIIAISAAGLYQSNKARTILIDCTIPEGECAQLARQSQASIISELVRVNLKGVIVVYECGESYKKRAAFEQCVEMRMEGEIE